MLSTLCTFGVKIGELTKNPCLYGGNTWSGTRRDCVWNDYQIQLVRQRVSDEMVLVFDLALETGQRGIPPLKWSTNWDMIIPFLGGLNDGWQTRKA